MSRLAHATLAAPGFLQEKDELAMRIACEAREANRLMHEQGLTRTEALRLAKKHADASFPTLGYRNPGEGRFYR